MAVSTPSWISVGFSGKLARPLQNENPLFHRYSSVDEVIVAEVVGASHSNFEQVRELVSRRPELSLATWDWAFGDWETALRDYRYGEGEKDGFSVKLNMRNHLSMGKLGSSGGSLFQKSPHTFSYNGVSSVEVRFSHENDQVVSLTVLEPDFSIQAFKVND